jgi:hypothetical protein
MVDENDLRKLFADSDAPNRLDANRVIAKSRVRRLPRQLGAAAITTLAVAGIGVLGLQTITQSPITSSMSGDEAFEAPAAPDAMDTMIKRAPADRLNLCEGTVAEPVPSFYGLQLDVAFPETAPATGEPVTGVVRLTNLSADRVTGVTASTPAITLSQGGLVLWHSNGPVDSSAVMVDLGPGATLVYPASFVPVRCAVQDDLAESFRPDLPPVPAGVYEVSAAIDFTAGAGMPQQDTPELDLVTGPRAPITLE